MIRWEENEVAINEPRSTFRPLGRASLTDATVTFLLGVDRVLTVARGRSVAPAVPSRLVRRLAR